MGKHLSSNHWFELINDWNNGLSRKIILEKYINFSGYWKLKANGIRTFFRTLKYRAKVYNKGMEYILTNKKHPSEMKKRGRPRKENKDQEIDWSDFKREELIEIAKRYVEITKDMPKREKTKESKALTETSITKISKLLKISRQSIYNVRKRDCSNKKWNSTIAEKYREEILEARRKHKNAGRAKLSKIMQNDFNIVLSERTLGRFLSKNNLNSEIRKRRRTKEIKDINYIGEDLVKRDYNDSQNLNIKCTDITYLPATKDAIQNHVYLSVIIDHRSKLVESFQLSFYNDLDLVMDNLNKNNFNNKTFIVHSDHGFQYTNERFIDKVKSLNGRTSYSRIGNSLDNREAEYWFSVLKTEFIRDLNVRNLTLKMLNDEIKKFINYYNNERIQSNLNWKTPKQFAMMS